MSWGPVPRDGSKKPSLGVYGDGSCTKRFSHAARTFLCLEPSLVFYSASRQRRQPPDEEGVPAAEAEHAVKLPDEEGCDRREDPAGQNIQQRVLLDEDGREDDQRGSGDEGGAGGEVCIFKTFRYSHEKEIAYWRFPFLFMKIGLSKQFRKTYLNHLYSTSAIY